MNWTRALHHLRSLADTCADMATRPVSIYPLRVAELWVAGPVLSGPVEVETLIVALTVDVEEVPWRTEPAGARHWAAAARLPHAPVEVFWRSTRVPVWNHVLHRPARVWSADDGVDERVIDRIAEGDAESVRAAAPSEAETRERLAADLAVSLAGLRDRTADYQRKRWRPGKLEPVADALWQASDGYLDLLRATN
ncbi:hypothetical protein V5P93_002741 [Actinokineospora auranticolor]|uniref:DUF7711 domain-containing protein n=1 Tax=Actinokineospora auranticolor TaxID=155976 RepID=A0A2S6H0F1_9PSEU|nr:hypothetical protein [Actinokineospora auranticolor]PPK70880.1 hypothetical protein CLV40_10166 [Actinokineospora auranticolor]